MCPASSAAGKSVCVVDASGQLGHALVDRLLQRGYAVHAATYANHAGESCNGVKKLWSEQKRVKVFRCDPLDYQSIANAVRGCSGVFCMFHSPQDQSTYDEVTVEVEVRAAQNVLEACAQSETVQRVVFTSSVTAVVWEDNHHSLLDTKTFDEKNWSDLNFCRKFKLWHGLAKTLSEKTAWALAMDRGVDMVAINAGLITGPGLSAAHPYLKGAPEMYDAGVLVTVDVDLLADAHVAVYETPHAYGRYLCFNHAACRPQDAVKLARMLSPAAQRSPPSDELKVVPQRIESKKLNKLMLEFASGRHGELE